LAACLLFYFENHSENEKFILFNFHLLSNVAETQLQPRTLNFQISTEKSFKQMKNVNTEECITPMGDP